ncbi:MAG: glycosyltransferase [Bacteroidetes bacterium]|nr:glycosyltransferase [Bacteroidota bacterium]
MPDISPKPVMVAVGIYVPGYGLTRVFEELFCRLSQYYTIHWLGIAWRGAVIEHPHYTLYPSNLKGGDMYGAAEAAAMAIEVQASVIWLLNDLYMLRNYRHEWEPLKQRNIKLIAYLPLDGDIVYEDIMADALFFDQLVWYNEWASEQASQAIQRFQPGMSGVMEKYNAFIYHGVDTEFFSSVSVDGQQALKEKLFRVPDVAEAVFILNANRYNERKDIETTIAGFVRASASFEKPAYLCLHTPGIDPARLDALQKKIDATPVAGRILLNPLGTAYITNELLRDLYRACEIGINTSLGEGWGLISFEHAACGGVQLVPAHSAPAIVWKDAAIQIPVKQKLWLDTSPFCMYQLNEVLLAEQLSSIVNDAEKRKQLRVGSYEHARMEIFDWKTIAQQWKQIIDALLIY